MKRPLITLILVCNLCCAYSQSGYVDSLESVIALNKQDVEMGKALNLLSSKYSRTDMNRAKAYAFSAIQIGHNINHHKTLSAGYANLVSIYQVVGKNDSSLFYLDELKNLAERTTGPEEKVVKGNYFSAAGLYYKKIGNKKEALPNFIQSVKYMEALGNKVATAGQSLNVANTLLDLGKYREAHNYYFKALQLFEELGNKEGQSFCLQGIGNSFCQLSQYDKALKYILQSLDMKKELGDKRGISTAYMSLGETYSGKKDQAKAIKYFQMSLELCRELKLVSEERAILYNLGRAYGASNDPALAEKYLQQSKSLAESAGDKSFISAADLELMSLKKDIAKRTASEEKLIESVNTLDSMGVAYKTLAGYQHLAKFYKEGEQFDKALEVKEKYYALRDSIQGNELKLLLRNMEEQYNANKKEKEIAILKKDQQLAKAKLDQQRSVQYGTITFFILTLIIGILMWNRYKVLTRAKRQVELERMRNDIARDLHDDIGSTLSSINIMSKVMLQSPSHNQEGLQKIREHSSNMMDSMSDIVWAINPMNDTFEKLVFRMKEFTAEILEPLNIKYQFEYDNEVANVRLDPARRKDLFLIFKETINNAAKYSGCKAININLALMGKDLVMKISDNGSGFNTIDAKEGNGLRNIRERAANLMADLNYNTEPGKGTSLLLSVPVT